MELTMTKERIGFHNLFVQIPEVIWDALNGEANATGEPVARIVTELLRKRYGISRDSLPKPKRAGRKPKNRTPDR